MTQIERAEVLKHVPLQLCASEKETWRRDHGEAFKKCRESGENGCCALEPGINSFAKEKSEMMLSLS